MARRHSEKRSRRAPTRVPR
ncbi:TPA_asm: UL37.5 uORF 2 [Human alphaherpesvirus 1]|nr:TPA_asm: UL37.5 uORF 2 [Human alphaherpesvirus 1]